MNPRTVVYVIDDDMSIRKSLARLIRATGLDVETYGSAQEFLSSDASYGPGCLVLDVRMPGITGLELQEKLASSNISMPIIFMTGYTDVLYCESNAMWIKAIRGDLSFIGTDLSLG